MTGLLQESEIKSVDNDGEEDQFEGHEDDSDADEKIFSVSKGHLDGMVGEVDRFMARGGYHVCYIGSVPVSTLNMVTTTPGVLRNKKKNSMTHTIIR